MHIIIGVISTTRRVKKIFTGNLLTQSFLVRLPYRLQKVPSSLQEAECSGTKKNYRKKNLQRTKKCDPNFLLQGVGLFCEDPVWGHPVWLPACLIVLHGGCLTLHIFILLKETCMTKQYFLQLIYTESSLETKTIKTL